MLPRGGVNAVHFSTNSEVRNGMHFMEISQNISFTCVPLYYTIQYNDSVAVDWLC